MNVKVAVTLLVASLASAYAQNHTVPEFINCGPEILVDDFSAHRTGALPGETVIRDLNLLGADYGKSEANLTYTINTEGKYVEIVAGPNAPPNNNFFFSKFDAGACYDLTHIAAVAYDLVAPVGSMFTMTLTQKSENCTIRVPGNSDSDYIPITKYVTPNGQKQSVVVPFADFKKNLVGGSFDFVHLKDWTLTSFVPEGARFQISNLRLIRDCGDNGPLGKNTTSPAGGSTPAPTTTGAPKSTGTTGGNSQQQTSNAGKLYGAAGIGLGTLLFGALAML
ncbi:hypothetical protein SpCBS45565_g03996 [Spizellomyces sp. 'palustris']|nr:hypothetical protein SpCBS45565_g03996 [Spizellomyces sp. 'palustris']